MTSDFKACFVFHHPAVTKQLPPATCYRGFHQMSGTSDGPHCTVGPIFDSQPPPCPSLEASRMTTCRNTVIHIVQLQKLFLSNTCQQGQDITGIIRAHKLRTEAHNGSATQCLTLLATFYPQQPSLIHSTVHECSLFACVQGCD